MRQRVGSRFPDGLTKSVPASAALAAIVLLFQPCVIASAGTFETEYQHHRPLTIAAAPAGYTVRVRLDSATTPTAAELYNRSQAATPGEDVRIVYQGVELNRDVTAFSSSRIEIWFKVQQPLSSPDSTSYVLYDGNATATAPPADKQQVYLWFDDFSTDSSSQYTIGRNASKGMHGRGAYSPVYDAAAQAVFANTGDNFSGDWKVIGVQEADVLAEYELRLTGSYPTNSTDGIVLRWQSSSQFYFGHISGGSYVSPAIAVNGRTSYISGGRPASKTYIPKDGTRHTLAVAAFGTSFKLWYDGTLMLTGTDATNQAVGDVAFLRSQSKGWMDNFKIRRYTEPEPGVGVGEEVVHMSDTMPPTISAISTSGITETGATITWTTDEPATSQVAYGLTASYGEISPLDSNLVTSHSVSLTGLSADTTYHNLVRSADATGNEAAGTDVTLTTAPAPDTSPPTEGSITINGGASATNDPAVTLTLSAQDDSGTVAFMKCSNDDLGYSDAMAYGPSQPWTLDGTEGANTVFVKFSDLAGNWSAPVSATIELDITPPGILIQSPLEAEVIPAP